MTSQRSVGGQAIELEGLLSRTVATVCIAYRAWARVRAGRSSGAMGTVASVRGSEW
jgi:hypothetical protein